MSLFIRASRSNIIKVIVYFFGRSLISNQIFGSEITRFTLKMSSSKHTKKKKSGAWVWIKRKVLCSSG